MENLGRGQAPPPALRKAKKKHAKDEIDRLKQAEKKKRRLEKALATSAAIRSELEKKKQKKEEQARLDEEGAAIAEAVALHVLLGEDMDESCQIMLNNNKRFNPLEHHSSNIGLFMDYQSFAKYSIEGMGWVSDAYSSDCKWNDWGNRHSLSPGMHVRDLQAPYYEEAAQGTEISAGLIAAQAASTLRITETLQKDLFTGQKAATVSH